MKYKKYYLLVLGCQMNYSDAERIKTVLSAIDLKQTKNVSQADMVIVVACSVRQRAVDRIIGRAQAWQSKRKKGQLFSFLTGCVNGYDQKKMASYFDLILPIDRIADLPEVLGNLKKIEVEDYFKIKPLYNSKFQAFVPIMTGCNNYCSYCIVPYVRGREWSRPIKDILNECNNLIKQGYKEITLLGQNVNSYKYGKTTFPVLLKKIDQIPGKWRLRFLTSHPKDFSDDLIKVIKTGKHITPYLHLALQSGDKDILKKMNRHYTPDQYVRLIKKIKKAIPNLMVSTDIIVGFPSETKKQFNNTLKIFKQIEFDMAYISKYSPRPQTAAAQLEDDVPSSEKKIRDRLLTDCLKKTALKHNQEYLGKKVEVLVEGCKINKCYGKTLDFRTVSFPGKNKLIGEFINVKINKVDSWGLFGTRENPNRS